MSRAFTAFVAAAVLLCATTASPAQKKTPPGKSRVSIRASDNPVLFRAPLTLTVSVKRAEAGLQVTVQRKTSTGAYVALATAATNAGGDVTFTRRLRRNTVLRAVTVEATQRASDDLLVKVAPRVSLVVRDLTPAAGQRVRFAGRVRPQHDGRRIQIERRQADGSWLVVARARLRDTGRPFSRFARRIAVSDSGVYRAVLPEHADHAAGVSRERTLTVAA